MQAMREEILRVLPDAAERIQLASQITGLEDVSAMDHATLRTMKAAHDAEIVSLQNRLDASTNEQWAKSGRRALHVLHAHRGWLADELRRRDRREAMQRQRELAQSAAAARAENLKRQREHSEAQHHARLQRIASANDDSAKAIAVFKEVALEVLGAEMYAHLWELARQRIEGEPAGGA